MKQLISFSFFLLLLSTIATGQVRLPRLVSNNAILQRDKAVRIWGWAAPGESVTLSFAGKKYAATANDKGNWSIQLPAQKAGGPYTMVFSASNEIKLNNILFGDVWVCSGQSNMELMMERVKYRYADEVNTVNNPFIRQFLVPDKYDFNNPQEDVEEGAWKEATTANIKEFSAVAYFFAKEIYTRHKIPIGLINASLGGSPAEAWISEEQLQAFPSHYQEVQRFKSQSFIDSIESSDRSINRSWYAKLNQADEGLKNNWRAPGIDDTGWETMQVPGYWADTKTGAVNGAIWFRKQIDIPAAMAGKPAKLELGRIIDADSVFINGQFAGTTSYQYPPRRYELAPGILKAGNNSIVVRVINNSGRGGFVPDKRYELTTATDTVLLSGNWKYKTGAIMKALPGQTFVRWKPAGLYNAMIAPLLNYAIKGVIWYQGEANTGRYAEYGTLMKTLISDWRSKWRQDNFPFLFVQLANYMLAADQPKESNWAALRQEQLNTLKVPNTGMAVAIELGDWNDVHPENKSEVGRRLALQAEQLVYGNKKIIAAGPLYRSMNINGNKIRLHFSNTGKGLVSKGGVLKQFTIAGADKHFVWAQAVIKGNTVEVWSDAIANPVIVRYAWADNPIGANLYNTEGLPASPFTTESF